MIEPSLPEQSPVELYNSRQFDIFSHISGRTYRVFVFKPDCAPPPSGYPVVVATDGNMAFPIMATVDATFSLTGHAAIVVCIGYPTDDPMKLFSLRNRDLTPPTPTSGLPQRPGQPPPNPEDYGGSEPFYRFLVEELRPLIAQMYPVDANEQALYGHSIAGLFTLWVLFNHPESFRSFVASSPAIWWNNRALLYDVPAFARNIESGEAAPRALLLVGSREQDVPPVLPPSINDAIAEKIGFLPSAIRNFVGKLFIKKMMRDWRMIDNARDLAAQLQQLKGAPGYSVRFHAFDGDDHLTALPASIGHALAFALKYFGE